MMHFITKNTIFSDGFYSAGNNVLLTDLSTNHFSYLINGFFRQKVYCFKNICR